MERKGEGGEEKGERGEKRREAVGEKKGKGGKRGFLMRKTVGAVSLEQEQL